MTVSYSVKVDFTRPGDEVAVVGDYNNWDVSKCVKFITNEKDFPLWSKELDLHGEFKIIIKNEGNIKWEDGSNRRTSDFLQNGVCAVDLGNFGEVDYCKASFSKKDVQEMTASQTQMLDEAKRLEAAKLEEAKRMEAARKLQQAKQLEEEKRYEQAKRLEEAKRIEAAKKLQQAKQLEEDKRYEQAKRTEAAKSEEAKRMEDKKLQQAKQFEEDKRLQAKKLEAKLDEDKRLQAKKMTVKSREE